MSNSQQMKKGLSVRDLITTGPCARILLLCSVVYFVATLAGCQSVGHVSSGRLFQKNQ